MKLHELAERLGLHSATGDLPDIDISAVRGLEAAGPSDVSYVADLRHLPLLATTSAGAVICSADHAARAGVPCLVSTAPAVDFARCSRLFARRPALAPGVHPTACVAATAVLGADVAVGAYAVVGERVRLGEGVQIFPHVTIYDDTNVGDRTVVHAGTVIREGTTIGADCLLHPNVVLGSDGFGFARRPDGSYEKIEQTGIVVVEDNVEIGSGTTIDRATFGETRIGRGSKIDNLVQIGHNCTVGPHTILCAQVGLAGSTELGARVTLAGQVGVAGHLTIGDGAVATAQTGIPASVEAGRVVSGYPAIDNRAWLKSSVAFSHLPDLQRTVRRLESRLAELEARAAENPSRD